MRKQRAKSIDSRTKIAIDFDSVPPSDQALEYRQPAVYTAFCSSTGAAASSGGGEDEGLGGGALAGIIIGGVVLLACFAYGCYNFVRENRAEAAAGDLSERRTMKKGMSFAWGRGMTMELGKKVGNPLGGRKKTAPEATAMNSTFIKKIFSLQLWF